MHGWTNRVLPVATAFGSDIVPLQRELREAAGRPEAQGALLDAYFLSRLDVSESKRTLWSLKSKIEAEQGLVRIDELCRASGVSIRHLDRLFRRHLGIAPKTFAQIVRFQRALALFNGDRRCTLAEVAAGAGYYDQPHFVREFHRFAGTTPKEKRGYFPPDAPTDFSPNLVQFLQDAGDE